MSAAGRIALFAALLALVFAGAFAAGSVLDPDPGGGQATTSEQNSHERGH